MKFLLFLGIQWFLSMFSQSFFQHRYAAHRQFEMSGIAEKFFFVFTWITQGAGYLSPTAYAIMHRLHHAYTDTEHDPHAPRNAENIFEFYQQTKSSYLTCLYKNETIDEKFKQNLPKWESFDKFAYSKYTRLAWLLVYFFIYYVFAPSLIFFLLIPLHLIIVAIQGGGVNWFAHKPNWGMAYRNFKCKNDSVNIMPFDFLFGGEGYHNNHHKFPNNSNFGSKWYEVDTTYLIMLGLEKIGIIGEIKKSRK